LPSSSYDSRLIPARTHGRILVREARGTARGILVGFHGYMENADIQMPRLEAVARSADWTLVSIQALHRFYRSNGEDVVASWMTRQDRDAAIADNIDYVDAALDTVTDDGASKVVYAGFSQGVAMAFRSGVRGRHPAAGIIAAGGDVPPELLQDPHLRFPPVFLARGVRDEWLTAEKFRADLNALAERGGRVRGHEFDAGHEWNEALTLAAAEFLESV
jgi:predicted esterase